MNIETKLQRIRELSQEKQELIETAVDKYREYLTAKTLQSLSQRLERAKSAKEPTRQFLLDALLQKPWTEAEGDRSQLKYRLSAMTGELRIVSPHYTEELGFLTLGLSGCLGATFGLAALTPPFRYIYGSSEIALTFAMLLGATIFPMLTWAVANNPSLRNAVKGALGIAIFAEVSLLAADMSGISQLWGGFASLWSQLSRNRSETSRFKRIFLYIGILLFLIFASKQPKFDEQKHLKDVKVCIEMWLDRALILLFSLEDGKRNVLEEKALAKLGRSLQDLHFADLQQLPDRVYLLLEEAAAIGFQGLQPPHKFENQDLEVHQEFLWDRDSKEKYKTFGDIQLGDRVYVVDLPVIVENQVKERGLVRKVRS